MSNMAFGSTLNPILGKRERTTVGATVIQLDPDKYRVISDVENIPGRLASGAALQIFTDSIYYTLDGTDPSSTVGMELAAGDIIYLDSFQKISNFKAVRKTTDASVEALYFFGN